ncbi:hypothetical protein [uncultured Microbacterium sp.]|uniref:hypothetical protein n=1 Tax=uncultured Microbacterium sp. TaxID=191216 RepID=UPI0028E5717A|nr:hypothetical protein [uncultured Microbacterium sp.]
MTIRHHPRVPESFVELLVAPLKHAPSAGRISGYSASEFRAVRRAMRSIVRAALTRVRSLEREVSDLPDNRENMSKRQRFLNHVASTGDIARGSDSSLEVAAPGATQVAVELFPSMVEVTAAAVLLQCFTGHNIGTILNLTVDHHRADDQSSESPTILVRSRKPRRGRYRAELDLALDSTDIWGDDSDDRDDFSSAAGIYRIVEELGRRARKLSNSPFLFVGYSHYRRRRDADGGVQGCRPLDDFSQHARHLQWMHLGETIVGVNSQRNRRSYLEQRQRPVDHTPQTLADTYLRRDPSALKANQRVVAGVLDSEVERVRASSAVRALTPEQVAGATADPKALAEDLGISVETLHSLLNGELDTVATACVDNSASPYSAMGSACAASFLMCFGCANARAEPRHAPVQRVLLDQLETRRSDMSKEEWSSRFDSLWDQVTDVLDRIAPDASQAAPEGTAQVISDLLDGRLDLR